MDAELLLNYGCFLLMFSGCIFLLIPLESVVGATITLIIGGTYEAQVVHDALHGCVHCGSSVRNGL